MIKIIERKLNKFLLSKDYGIKKVLLFHDFYEISDFYKVGNLDFLDFTAFGVADVDFKLSELWGGDFRVQITGTLRRNKDTERMEIFPVYIY